MSVCVSCLSVYPSIDVSVHLCVCVCLSVYKSIHLVLSIHVSVYLSVCLSSHFLIDSFVCLSCLSFCLSSNPFMHGLIHLSIYPSIHPSIRPSVHPSVRPSIHLSISVFLSIMSSFYLSINPKKNQCCSNIFTNLQTRVCQTSIQSFSCYKLQISEIISISVLFKCTPLH